jgi:membrane-bound lytic murein transglycosylase D
MKRNSLLLILLLIVSSLFLMMFFTPKPDDNIRGDKLYFETAERQYRIFSLMVPDSLTFAGEPVPVDKFYVRERLERELLAVSFLHSRTMLVLKKSARYFPVFWKIFQQHGIHSDFMFLAMAESELSFVVSPSDAAGIWQFLKGTAQHYGLEVNDDVDERYHVEKSTDAACRYLKDAYARFNSWTMAAAAYNMGATRIPGAIEEQKVDSYYDLILPEETMRYVYRILAYKLVWENPVRYGFILRNADLYYPVPVKNVEVNTSVPSLAEFAVEHNTNLLVLKDLNPWLRKATLKNNSAKKYQISVPLENDWQTIMKDVKYPARLMNDTIEIR